MEFSMDQTSASREPEEQKSALSAGETGAKSLATHPASAQSRKTILIVDDIAVMRLRMRPQLEEAGYRVIEAEDGKKALEIIRDEMQNGPGIDLIVSDISMPIMDGLEMIRKLRHDLAIHHLPVIVCTARGELGVVREAKAIGVQGFLVKPVAKPTLLAAIQRELK